MTRDEVRVVIEHALESIDEGMYGEAWLALKAAMDKLERLDQLPRDGVTPRENN